MNNKKYNKNKALQYARIWALDRNPKYYNYDEVGGDCTSFISQVIYAGSGIMNYNLNGWYYKNGNDKSPSWSGVEYLHKFLLNNKSIGPYGREIDIEEIEEGDVVQLSFDGYKYHHTLVVVDIVNNIKSYSNILIAAHTEDSYNRRISSYTFKKIRFIKIEGVRFY